MQRDREEGREREREGRVACMKTARALAPWPMAMLFWQISRTASDELCPCVNGWLVSRGGSRRREGGREGVVVDRFYGCE